MRNRRDQILDAAAEIIATSGARRFTAQALADAVGLTPGALFRHFKSMEAIVAAVVDRMEDALFHDTPPTAFVPLDQLESFFRRRVQALVESPNLSRLLLTDHLAQAGGPEQAKRVAEFRRRSQRWTMACLREARTLGLLSEDLSPEAAGTLVMGAIMALAHDKAVNDGLVDEVWSGLARALKRGERAHLETPPLAAGKERRR